MYKPTTAKFAAAACGLALMLSACGAPAVPAAPAAPAATTAPAEAAPAATDKPAEAAATPSGEIIIGLITKTETNPFFVKMREGATQDGG